MYSKELECDIQHSCIAIVGQIGHGKKTLMKAIEKVGELQKTGKSSDVNGTLYSYIIPSKATDFIHTLMSGKLSINGEILVVSADEGPMPQTREYILFARQIGINRMIVFINKVEEVDETMLLKVEKDTRNLLEEYNFNADDILVIKGSALKTIESDSANLESPWYLPITELLNNLGNFDKERVLI